MRPDWIDAPWTGHLPYLAGQVVVGDEQAER